MLGLQQVGAQLTQQQAVRTVTVANDRFDGAHEGANQPMIDPVVEGREQWAQESQQALMDGIGHLRRFARLSIIHSETSWALSVSLNPMIAQEV